MSDRFFRLLVQHQKLDDALRVEQKRPFPDFIKLQNGHLVLVYNNSKRDRMPLTVAISTDNDQSYPYQRNIVDKSGDSAAYPFAIQTKDGRIHVLYTSDRRTVINHASFDESAILNTEK